jgi:hypothetical protein
VPDWLVEPCPRNCTRTVGHPHPFTHDSFLNGACLLPYQSALRECPMPHPASGAPSCIGSASRVEIAGRTHTNLCPAFRQPRVQLAQTNAPTWWWYHVTYSLFAGHRAHLYCRIGVTQHHLFFKHNVNFGLVTSRQTCLRTDPEDDDYHWPLGTIFLRFNASLSVCLFVCLFVRVPQPYMIQWPCGPFRSCKTHPKQQKGGLGHSFCHYSVF